MRQITKIISIPVNGKSMDFRLTKLDAFSGVTLLRLLAHLPESHAEASGTRKPEQRDGSHRYANAEPENRPGRSEAPVDSPVLALFSALSDTETRSLMTTCLEHVEVLLPAGWNPVMTQGTWSYSDLKYEPGICLKLTIEEIVWTLEGFFGEGGSTSHTGTPAT